MFLISMFNTLTHAMNENNNVTITKVLSRWCGNTLSIMIFVNIVDTNIRIIDNSVEIVPIPNK